MPQRRKRKKRKRHALRLLVLESRQGGFFAWCARFLDSDGQSFTFSEPGAHSGGSYRGVLGSPGHPIPGLNVVGGVGPSGDLGPCQAPEA